MVSTAVYRMKNRCPRVLIVRARGHLFSRKNIQNPGRKSQLSVSAPALLQAGETPALPGNAHFYRKKAVAGNANLLIGADQNLLQRLSDSYRVHSYSVEFKMTRSGRHPETIFCPLRISLPEEKKPKRS